VQLGIRDKITVLFDNYSRNTVGCFKEETPGYNFILKSILTPVKTTVLQAVKCTI